MQAELLVYWRSSKVHNTCNIQVAHLSGCIANQQDSSPPTPSLKSFTEPAPLRPLSEDTLSLINETISPKQLLETAASQFVHFHDQSSTSSPPRIHRDSLWQSSTPPSVPLALCLSTTIRSFQRCHPWPRLVAAPMTPSTNAPPDAVRLHGAGATCKVIERTILKEMAKEGIVPA